MHTYSHKHIDDRFSLFFSGISYTIYHHKINVSKITNDRQQEVTCRYLISLIELKFVLKVCILTIYMSLKQNFEICKYLRQRTRISSLRMLWYIFINWKKLFHTVFWYLLLSTIISVNILSIMVQMCTICLVLLRKNRQIFVIFQVIIWIFKKTTFDSISTFRMVVRFLSFSVQS